MTLWYFHGEAAARFFAIAYVGYGTKLVFISFASYSAGLIISVLTEIGLGLLAILIIHLPGRYFTKRLSTGVWQSSAFRKLNTAT